MKLRDYRSYVGVELAEALGPVTARELRAVIAAHYNVRVSIPIIHMILGESSWADTLEDPDTWDETLYVYRYEAEWE